MPPQPIAETLGFGLSELSTDHSVFTVPPAEYHSNPIGSVHGGLVATLRDFADGLRCAHHHRPAGDLRAGGRIVSADGEMK